MNMPKSGLMAHRHVSSSIFGKEFVSMSCIWIYGYLRTSSLRQVIKILQNQKQILGHQFQGLWNKYSTSLYDQHKILENQKQKCGVKSGGSQGHTEMPPPIQTSGGAHAPLGYIIPTANAYET